MTRITLASTLIALGVCLAGCGGGGGVTASDPGAGAPPSGGTGQIGSPASQPVASIVNPPAGQAFQIVVGTDQDFANSAQVDAGAFGTALLPDRQATIISAAQPTEVTVHFSTSEMQGPAPGKSYVVYAYAAAVGADDDDAPGIFPLETTFNKVEQFVEARLNATAWEQTASGQWQAQIALGETTTLSAPATSLGTKTTLAARPPLASPLDIFGEVKCPFQNECIEVSQFNLNRYLPSRVVAFHKGMDLKAACRTEIFAQGNGKVVFVQDLAAWKNTSPSNKKRGLGIALRVEYQPNTLPAASFQVQYQHLDEMVPGIGLGSSITSGQLLGYSGRTGSIIPASGDKPACTADRTSAEIGPHLHLEVYAFIRPQNGAPNSFTLDRVDPFARMIETMDIGAATGENLNRLSRTNVAVLAFDRQGLLIHSQVGSVVETPTADSKGRRGTDPTRKLCINADAASVAILGGTMAASGNCRPWGEVTITRRTLSKIDLEARFSASEGNFDTDLQAYSTNFSQSKHVQWAWDLVPTFELARYNGAQGPGDFGGWYLIANCNNASCPSGAGIWVDIALTTSTLTSRLAPETYNSPVDSTASFTSFGDFNPTLKFDQPTSLTSGNIQFIGGEILSYLSGFLAVYNWSDAVVTVRTLPRPGFPFSDGILITKFSKRLRSYTLSPCPPPSEMFLCPHDDLSAGP